MSFEIITDRDGRSLRPAIHYEEAGPQRLVFLLPQVWGGVTEGGIYVDYDNEDLPAVYGVLYAIRDDSPINIVNLARDDGGLMPGDLFVFPRHAAWRLTTIDLETKVQAFRDGQMVDVVESLLTHVMVMRESEILCRIDGILPDPWEEAKAKVLSAALIGAV